jgi:hypothetical protein
VIGCDAAFCMMSFDRNLPEGAASRNQNLFSLQTRLLCPPLPGKRNFSGFLFVRRLQDRAAFAAIHRWASFDGTNDKNLIAGDRREAIAIA